MEPDETPDKNHDREDIPMWLCQEGKDPIRIDPGTVHQIGSYFIHRHHRQGANTMTSKKTRYDMYIEGVFTRAYYADEDYLPDAIAPLSHGLSVEIHDVVKDSWHTIFDAVDAKIEDELLELMNGDDDDEEG